MDVAGANVPTKGKTAKRARGVAKPLCEIKAEDIVTALVRRGTTLYYVTDKPNKCYPGLEKRVGDVVLPVEAAFSIGWLGGRLVDRRGRRVSGRRLPRQVGCLCGVRSQRSVDSNTGIVLADMTMEYAGQHVFFDVSARHPSPTRV